ncbi:hypothetical protein UY286_04925 [Paenibacillus polymyxa]|uniref:glycosyltransferase n=1 Tax=Paenibacillus polymyxa TaxID=1406 RepID=UPI002AB3EEF9|nr:hypothetical protein [Paenibacillus polymyxa]MDY7989860.1 hypothetical protein [Paenibacillus polymyxa]MDY8116781.1 hypothetical protein [Paenibacillus polymyxa]
MNISIVIPIKVKKETNLDGFITYIKNISNSLVNDDVQIVISDGSNLEIASKLHGDLAYLKNVTHFMLEEEYRTGRNDKLNGIYAALKVSKFDNILLIDDHFRITRATLFSLSRYYLIYDLFKTMPKFEKYPVSALIDLCGIYIINLMDYRKQYCGHLAFKKSLYMKVGFPDRDGLFDEFIMEEKLREYNFSIGFVRDVAIEAVQENSVNKFFEQRIRYAYENFAFPLRTALFLTILPLTLLLFLSNYIMAIKFIVAISITTITVAGIGQLIYNREAKAPKFTFLFGVFWFWFYPFTTWIALFKFFSGGVYFGNRKIKRAK